MFSFLRSSSFVWTKNIIMGKRTLLWEWKHWGLHLVYRQNYVSINVWWEQNLSHLVCVIQNLALQSKKQNHLDNNHTHLHIYIYTFQLHQNLKSEPTKVLHYVQLQYKLMRVTHFDFNSNSTAKAQMLMLKNRNKMLCVYPETDRYLWEQSVINVPV